MTKLRDIVKTNNIIRISPTDTLSHALARLSTSHDAAFAFDEENKFKGVINPYYSVIKTSYPGNAKVEHCLFHAPHIKLQFPTSKVAQLFIESKVHYLPVFDDQDKFMGIISARRLLSELRKFPFFNMRIGEMLAQRKQGVITIDENDAVTHAINLFKKTKISKLVVVGKDKKLKGVLSYYDLISYLIAPKTAPHRGERDAAKTNFGYMKVRNFAKTYVLTLDDTYTVFDALKLILEKKIGSVVIIDREKHPIGIVTTKDLLKLLIRKEKGEEIEVISKNVSLRSRQILGGFFNHFYLWIKKVPNLSKVKLFVKEEKQGGLFKIVLSLIPKSGKMVVIKKEGRDLTHTLQDVLRKKSN